MTATPSPQVAATMASLRRSGGVAWPVIGLSQRSDQYPRSLDQGDGKNQRDENTERDRDRDRAASALALLRRGQDETGFAGLPFHHEAHANTRPNGMPKSCTQSARSASSTANSTNATATEN